MRRAHLNLLLEQILERLPRVAGPQTGWRRGFLFASHADFVKRAIVARVFLRYSFLDRLHALETAAGIKIHTLLARMQFKPALRTLPGRRHPLKHGAALRTP